MVELTGVLGGLAVLALAGAIVEHQKGILRVVGAVMGTASGGLTGGLVAVTLALLTIPGACVAVLCPSCYREPASEQVWRAGLVYFTVLGGLAGLLPGRSFRIGFDLGASMMVLRSVDYWSHNGAGLTIVLGLALAILGWAIHLTARESRGHGGDAPGSTSGPGTPTSLDHWDGTRWTAPASGGCASRSSQAGRPS